jgi:dihydroflavonol-4-reductase
MTFLVTGATGFVGSAVARRLLAAGGSVRVLARPSSDRRNLEGLNVELYAGDVNDAQAVTRAVAGCEGVFHVAADYRLWVRDPGAMYRTNVEGTRCVVDAALHAGVRRIVYTSSVATLGLRADGEPSNEDAPSSIRDMIGPYKRSKFMAEELVRERAAAGAAVVIVNPSTPVGPGDVKPTPTGRMIVDALAGRMPAYVDTGLNVVHVDDVARGHLLAYECGGSGRRYVLGGENVTLRHILALCSRIAGRRAPSVRLPTGVVLPVAYLAEAWAALTGRTPLATVDGVRMARKRMYFTSARAEHELGYRFRDADAALHDAAAWFRAHGYVKW